MVEGEYGGTVKEERKLKAEQKKKAVMFAALLQRGPGDKSEGKLKMVRVFGIGWGSVLVWLVERNGRGVP